MMQYRVKDDLELNVDSFEEVLQVALKGPREWAVSAYLKYAIRVSGQNVQKQTSDDIRDSVSSSYNALQSAEMHCTLSAACSDVTIP